MADAAKLNAFLFITALVSCIASAVDDGGAVGGTLPLQQQQQRRQSKRHVLYMAGLFSSRTGSGDYSSHHYVVAQQPTTQLTSSASEDSSYASSSAGELRGLLTAVEMALEIVNSRSDVLPSAELRLSWNDSKVGLSSPPFPHPACHVMLITIDALALINARSTVSSRWCLSEYDLHPFPGPHVSHFNHPADYLSQCQRLTDFTIHIERILRARMTSRHLI